MSDFHLPVDDIAKDVPFPLRGKAKELLKRIDEMDLNKDGKRDLAQAVGIGLALYPFFAQINQIVDFELAAEKLAEAPFIKDQALAKEALKAVGSALERI